MSTGRIYAYSAPGYDVEWTRTVGTTTITGRGKLKVGQTGRADSAVRIKEQTGTVYPGGEGIIIHLDEPAVRVDGSTFSDTDVHHMLDTAGISRSSEVVKATLEEVQAAILAVRHRTPFESGRTLDYPMRDEQQRAVEMTAAYFAQHRDDTNAPRFLWNAKMRFGKTFTTYQLAKKLSWRRVLVLTYKPAVHDAWKSDLARHADFSGWQFSDRENPADLSDLSIPTVCFASFQDLLGKGAEGAIKARNEYLHLTDWDAIVIDEYHFGAWRGAAKELVTEAKTVKDSVVEEQEAHSVQEALDLAASGTPRLGSGEDGSEEYSSLDLGLRARNYLYLSGTPFRALTEGEFNEDAIFNWTYPDEQRAKAAYVGPEANPYAELPEMKMFTYSLSGFADAATEQAIKADPESDFSLSAYFAAIKQGPDYRFSDPERVRGFLDLLCGKISSTAVEKLINGRRPPLPYADDRFIAATEHTVWYLPSIASVYAMKDALAQHPYFRDVKVAVAAGNGAGMGAKALEPVRKMITDASRPGARQRTVTLSVGKLMTGVTVPEWGAILILTSLKAPESYFQAAFRVQSPWTVSEGGHKKIEKDECFVFDFDPNRTLSLIYSYGTKLAGAGTEKSPNDEIADLLLCLPIFAFQGGRMEQVSVDAVMDWATAGTGAAMLAKRWRSPRLINLSDDVLAKVLAAGGLTDRLNQIEDFRKMNVRESSNAMLSASKKLKKAKERAAAARAAGSTDAEEAEDIDETIKEARRERKEQEKSIRDKLLKLAQRIPVFMYLTDYREEQLTDVITSLDSGLFERITGLDIADFKQLTELGVFDGNSMNEAIWQFRIFEEKSLVEMGVETFDPDRKVGLFNTTTTHSQLKATEAHGSIKVDPLLTELIQAGAVSAGDVLLRGSVQVVVASDGAVLMGSTRYGSLAAAADSMGSDGDQEWIMPGYGTLEDMRVLLD